MVYFAIISVFANLRVHSTVPERLKTDCCAPLPTLPVSDSVGLGSGIKMCTSKSPGDTHTAGLETTL